MHRSPKIDPLINDWLHRFDPNVLTEHGSFPCSVHFPSIFKKTVSTWQGRIDQYGFDYQIAFACKATGFDRYALRALQAGTMIDVASVGELKHALAIGFTPEKIIANGPKNKSYLHTAVQSGVIIVINALSERKQLLTYQKANQTDHNISVLFRITTLGSRFGLSLEALYGLHNDLAEYQEIIAVHGVSMHSDSVSIVDKRTGILDLIKAQSFLCQSGHNAEILNIGGGYRVQYCSSRLEQQLPREYNQAKGLYGLDYLDALIMLDVGGESFQDYLVESLSTLIIEPGRALLDQSGMVIHTVIEQRENGIVIDGNIYSLGTIAQEMPHDPLFWTDMDGLISQLNDSESIEITLYGNLCLEADKLFSREIAAPKTLTVGDTVLFFNTAGYTSDFSNAQPIMHNDRKHIIINLPVS